jgi:hypothetical protein
MKDNSNCDSSKKDAPMKSDKTKDCPENKAKQFHRIEKALVFPNGTEIIIGSKRRTFGRMDFFLVDGFPELTRISRVHFSIFEEDGFVYLLDEGGINGTKLNGIRIRKQEKQIMKNGDEIDVADAIKLIFKTI